LYEAHREHYGKDDEHVLIWQAETRAMNPTIDQRLIDRELERDPDAASAEWLATFRTDLSAAFSPESLEACTIKGRNELPASPLIQYQAFVDPSGGKHDSFTLAIGHKAEDKAVIDVARAWHSPLDPKIVTGEIGEVLRGYGVLNVTGDRFAAEWPVAEFREHGIGYQQCEQSKSDLYLAFIPVTNSGGVELTDDKMLLTQLGRLERKRGRTGKDTVDHPPRLHDDLANAVAGVSYVLQGNAKAGHQGFNPLLHVAPKSLRLVEGDWPLFVGLSSGDRIVATVLGQPYNAELRVLAAFVSEGSSVQGHLLQHTKPWMVAHAGSLRILGSYEDVTNARDQVRAARGSTENARR
jgi:hypothetical protein